MNYEPSELITQLATDGSFSDFGKQLFYSNEPTLSDRSTFYTQCTIREKTVVLGCFTGQTLFDFGQNIYIFDVEDERLNGIEQVTAAHEMLHVAYSRLSSSERQHIDELINAVYSNISDPRIASLAASYEEQDPASVPNELHSIIATEVSDIGEELETYYSRYFSKRSQVVAYAEGYEQVFEDLHALVEQYDADLTARKAEITQREAALAGQEATIRGLNEQLYTMLDNGQIEAYNSLVPSYNRMVNSYNQEVAAIQDLIGQYNAIVITRNAIVVEQQDLAQSIDSRPSAITQ